MSKTVLNVGTMQIDNHSTGSFPVSFLLSEISNSTRVDFLSLKNIRQKKKKNSFIQFILDS